MRTLVPFVLFCSLLLSNCTETTSRPSPNFLENEPTTSNEKYYVKDDTYQVLFVAILARHGARTPASYFFNQADWNNLPLKCITPEGMRMHYVLGNLMRERYIPSLLPATPEPGLTYFVADYSQRTKFSVMSFMMGLYPAYTGQNINSNNEFTAVPPNPDPSIQNIAKNMRLSNTTKLPALGFNYGMIEIDSPIKATLLFNADDDTVCKQVKTYLSNIKATTDYKNTETYLNTTYWQPLVDIINSQAKSFQLKHSEISFGVVDDLYDSYVSTQFEQLPNFNIPSNILAGMVQTLTYDKYYYSFGDSHVRNASVSLIFSDIGKRMGDVVSGKSSAKKFAVYLGHDHNIYSYLIIFLGVDSASKLKYANPPFAANLAFELLKSKTNSQLYVRVMYNDLILKLQQCQSEPCTWTEFSKVVDDSVIDKLSDFCDGK